jgi:putative ABC transport system permease protein
MPDWRPEIEKQLAGAGVEPSREVEIIEELQQHLDDRYQELVSLGRAQEDAYHAVLAELSDNQVLARELQRVERRRHRDHTPPGSGERINPLRDLWSDVRYGARLLRLSPGFSVIAILSLALGIGANAAIFQLLDAVRLRSLPVKNPQELAEVMFSTQGRSGSFTGRRPNLSNALWQQIRDRQQAFSGIFAFGADKFNLTTSGEARYARGLWVSGDFFNVLGVQPLLGRLLTAQDDVHGCGTASSVISYAFWQREFGGNPGVIGKKLLLDAHPIEIVGVTPPDFFGVEVGWRFDVALPLCAELAIQPQINAYNKRNWWWLAAMGRLKPGWTLKTATMHLNAISPGILEATLPEMYTPDMAKQYLSHRLAAFPAESGFSELRTAYENPLWLLLGIAAMVLLIACANLANLMLARSSVRQREIAIRLALGATRGRVIRQLLAESAVLALAGAGLGAGLAQALSRSLLAFLSTSGGAIPLDLSLDWRWFAFMALLAVVTCLFFGLTPALRAGRTSPGTAMKASARGLTAARERFGLRRVLVVGQLALSLVLLMGAFLFVHSLQKLLTQDAGIQMDGLLVASIDFTRLRMANERIVEFKKELLDQLRVIPGVQSVTIASILPLSGSSMNDLIVVEGSQRRKDAAANENWVGPGYFKTMGTPLIAGRDFDDHDLPRSPLVAIVTERFVERFLNGKNPLGSRFQVEEYVNKRPKTYQIVGVVKNEKYLQLKEDFVPIFFLPDAQANAEDPDMSPNLMIRHAEVSDLTGWVKRAIEKVNPDVSLSFVNFNEMVRQTLVRERLMALLAGFFGFLAALLATIGLYGVISYMVAGRTNEIGIRMALGADRQSVVGMIMREAGILLGIGVVLGGILSLFAAQTARAMLFGLKPGDPLTLATAIMFLATVALLASYLPARRAAKLDPMMALREE